jgi:hypothetical protein
MRLLTFFASFVWAMFVTIMVGLLFSVLLLLKLLGVGGVAVAAAISGTRGSFGRSRVELWPTSDLDRHSLILLVSLLAISGAFIGVMTLITEVAQ